MLLIPRGLVFANLFLCFSDIHALRTRDAIDLVGSGYPNFTAPISNVTIAIGREAILECKIDKLSTYKVAWLRVDTQTILTIHHHVITKNHRIAVTGTDHRNWYLHIRDVRESDKGWYMCQINTDPMKSQMGYLDVVVPPDILDYPTSTDMVVREGSNVSLQCAATGSPEPTITWRREGGELLSIGTDKEGIHFEGPVLNISKVNRLQMGPYLCIASNGVPPSVSKRIMLIVHFAPMIWIQNQLVSSARGQQVTLECHSEAFPKSINYWTRKDGRIISQGTKYDPSFKDNTYKVHMNLTIRNVSASDFGTYTCIAKNSLGETDGTIKLEEIILLPTSKPKTETTTPVVTVRNSEFSRKTTAGKNLKSTSSRENNGSKTENLEQILSSPSTTSSACYKLDFTGINILYIVTFCALTFLEIYV